MTQALRHDQGKPELDYLDTFWVALEGVARNCMYGASKYDLFNYMRGAKSSRESYNCTRRHMLAWMRGEDWVPDALEAGFNVHHIDAAIWNLCRLRQELHDFPERDDRPFKVLARATNKTTKTVRRQAAPRDQARGKSSSRGRAKRRARG